MNLGVIILFICFITIYITIYILTDGGMWNNIETLVPKWSEKYLIVSFLYIFIVLVTISWIYTNICIKNSSFKSLNNSLYVLILVLFFFSIFCLSHKPVEAEEAFIISIIILSLLIFNSSLTMLYSSPSGKIFSLVPLLLYLYIFVWIYEIKNKY